MAQALVTLGTWLLVAGAAIVVLELLALAGLFLRLRRRVEAFRVAGSAARAEIEARLAAIRADRAEIAVRLRPYRRVRRWLRHPLVAALVVSYRRRRAAA